MMQAPRSSSAFTATSISGKQHLQPGRTCVLLRGLIRSRHHWSHFPQLLNQRPSVHQVILPELAGNGERSLEATPATLHDMMEDLRQQTRQLLPEPPPKLTLIAISMGGMIATEWASCYPQEIAELHLINTSFGRFSAPWQRMRPRALTRLLRATPGLIRDPAALEAPIMELTLNHPAIQHQQLQDWQDFSRAHPMTLTNIAIQIRAASRYQGTAQSPCQRAFIYTSLNDQLVSAQCSQAIAKHWNKPLWEHPSAGHDLPLDDGTWLAECFDHTARPAA